MKKKQSKRFSGVAWAFTVIGIGVLVIVVLLGMEANEFFHEEQAEEVRAEAEPEDNEDRSEEPINELVQQFIGEMHQFYNETTGYGEIEQLNWEEQVEQASKIIDVIESAKSTVDHEALTTDLNNILILAERVTEEQTEEHVRQLHRYFHDLDIVINGYDESDEIWDVTETLEAN
jgi:flagellin-specific chaperone FliS